VGGIANLKFGGNMMDTIVTIILAAVPVLLLYKTIQDWRQSKNHWFVLPLVLFLLAIFAILADWWNGLLTVVFGLVAYAVIGRFSKK
jgi:ABC-type polysaccharide/polyol phosphate export permease